MRSRRFALLGAVIAAVLLFAAACSSGADSASSSSAPVPSGSSSGSGSGSPSALPTDAAADQIADQFKCQVTESTSQSSESVAASNSESSGGGLGVPVSESSVKCHRQAFDYDIASFDNTEGKQKVIDFLTGLVEASKSQYAYCDGGLWVVNVDVDIKDQPTPAQIQKLQRGAEVAHEELGCKVVMIGSADASGNGGSPTNTITASVRPTSS